MKPTLVTRAGVALCRRCQSHTYVIGSGALSRADNRTEVCSGCGTDEALVTMAARGAPTRTGRHVQAVRQWPVEWQPATIEMLAGVPPMGVAGSDGLKA